MQAQNKIEKIDEKSPNPTAKNCFDFFKNLNG